MNESQKSNFEPPFHDHLTVPKLRGNTGRRTLSSIDTQGDSRNSIGQVWAEDYCEFDFGIEGGDTKGDNTYFLQEPSPDFPATRKYSEEKELPPIPVQQSFASFLPSFGTTSKPSLSPTKTTPDEEAETFMPTLTGDRGGRIDVADRSKGLASWFTGSSAPVSVGIANDQETSATATTYATNIASKFNIFTATKTASKMDSVRLPADLNNDELLTMDIEKVLFPGGKDQQDPFSPAAFNNLLMNAEGLLLKIQTGYKLRTLALHEFTSEKEALAEELEEVKTRAECFKLQMEDMVHQFSEKDDTIAKLKRELALEKQFRKEEQEAREKSISLVRENTIKRSSISGLSIDTQIEDLGISAATSSPRQWRRSGNSNSTLSADGDSDTESGADSVFSRSLSPALTTNSFNASSANLSLAEQTSDSPAPFTRVVSPMQLRPKPVPQRSTFQKILTTMKAGPAVKDPYDGLGMGLEGCSNCRGQGASVAWDTVGLMRVENKGLKERVGELESALDQALDVLIYGPPIHQ